MNNEFDWWLLIVGLVGGAGIVWLMLSTGREPSPEDEADDRRAEADWITSRLSELEHPVDEPTVLRILTLHRDWETGGSEIDWDWDASPAGRANEPAAAPRSVDHAPDLPARRGADAPATASNPTGSAVEGRNPQA